MNMRTGAIGGADRWGHISISFDELPHLDGNEHGNLHGKVPGNLHGSSALPDADPLDIDADVPRSCSAKRAPRHADPAERDETMDRGLVMQLLQIFSLLGLLKQRDDAPDTGDKGKTGDAHTGKRKRAELPGEDGEGREAKAQEQPKLRTRPSEGKPRLDDRDDDDDNDVKSGPAPRANDRTGEAGDKEKAGDDKAGKTGKTTRAGGPGKIPEPQGTVTVHDTIVVKAGEVFDGGGKLYKAGKELGDGSQREDQKPVFRIEPGGVLRNLQYEGADGIHTMGDATIEDVWARDVGEDAMTMKKPGNVTWSGGGAFNAHDKIFQLNAGGSFTLENFTADGFGKAVRTNGGHQIDTDIVIRNSHFENGDEAIVRTDSTLASILLEGVTFNNVPNDVLAPDGTKVGGAVKRGSK